MSDFNFLEFDMPENPPTGETYEYYIGLKNRELWLDTDVATDEGTMLIVKQIIRWNREDINLPIEKRKPIILYCFSYGGDLDVCNSIIDTIRASKTPVYGVNAGRCMSAAAYIYISCHKRLTFNHSYFLFHQGSGLIGGTASEMESHYENYEKQVAALSELMKQFTKYSDEDIKKNIKKEWYVNSDEAMTNGVCDKVIDNLDEVIF